MPVRDIRIVKSRIRDRIKASRAAMPQGDKARFDKSIKGRIMRMREYINCEILFTYVSKPTEVDTHAIISSALAQGKKVAVPKCLTETRQMDFYFISGFDDLEKGAFGVPEPIPEKCTLVSDYSKGFCIVPGLSFDSEGYRLGYGKGYYDRFFSKFKGYSAGLCYSNFMKWKLPHGRYDKNVDVVVTERFVRHIKKHRDHLIGDDRTSEQRQ